MVVVGGGSREHAIVLRLLASNKVDKVYALPGNPGILQSDSSKVTRIGKLLNIKTERKKTIV